MSVLSQFSGGGIKQIKTGFVKAAAPTNSGTPGAASDEDYYYYDVTLTGDPISDITKSVVLFDGAGHYLTWAPGLSYGTSNSITYNTRVVVARLLNTTTLRLSQQYDPTVGFFGSPNYYNTTGRWTIIEYR